ncbi:tyrosine-type recombinase/integrase [Sphingomonas abietis]|uniref:Integrase arm-type DNA-binding domain-containing protein n=1 Tax=Sphingomonas abietis TaxID=3012344 RepID=A0ABY7NHI9_9SPHN|nr:integrase arm-type DNA-binding domain-containing protein [Sphingomonas abietis]WBO20993.1 integrase arm-type DNA-binding domain-containing protein [Sphingomonas abietis]
MALTNAEVKNAQPAERDYKLGDSGGLYLFVTTKGAKSWRFKYRYAGKEKRLTFGLYDEVKLADARARRDEARAILKAGRDPMVEEEKRKAALVVSSEATFKSLADAWQEDERPGWSASHAARVCFRLDRDVYPALGRLPIGDITGSMVLRELRKIEKRGSIETAKRVKGYIVSVFKRAKAERLISQEQVLDVSEIAGALKPTPTGAKQPALIKVDELLEFQRAVDRSTCDPRTKLCSRFVALTSQRIGVVRTATWGEFSGIDWDDPDAAASDAVWTIPAARMKLEVEDKGSEAFGHDVPLSRQAVEVLRALRVRTGKHDLLFPGGKSWRVPMSDSAVSSMYKRLAGGRYKGRMVPHGWRSAFSTLMNERAARLKHANDRMMIDMMLAHVPQGMSASEWAYNRAVYLDPRREIGQAWADLITAELAHPMTLLDVVSSVTLA